jgi:hypothetical protein
VKLDELFSDVAPPDDAADTPNNPRLKEASITELLAEALTRVAAQERQPRAAGQDIRWAARPRDPGAAPERVQWLSADAPSAKRVGAGGNQQDEAQ